MSDQLLDRLTGDLRAVPSGRTLGRLAAGLGIGVVVAVLCTQGLLGARPDLAAAILGAMFWVKLAYALSLAAIGLWASERLVRPGGLARGRAVWLILPLLALAALATWQLLGAGAGTRRPMIMGHSSMVCPVFILLASIPPLAGLVWAVRGLAPTRLRLAGAGIGLTAGGAGAAAYALCCNESAAPFVALWYSLGVAGAAGMGALLGPRLLRW